LKPAEITQVLVELNNSISGCPSSLLIVAKVKEFLDDILDCCGRYYPCHVWNTVFTYIVNFPCLMALQSQDRKGCLPSIKDDEFVKIMQRKKLSFMEDGVPLWERLTSRNVVPILFQNKIELSLVIHNYEENPSNGVPKGWQVHAPYPRYGKPPFLNVICNWKKLNEPGNLDLPEEKLQMLEEGDILNANAVRDYYGISTNSMVSNTIRNSHPACVDAFIIARWYKNDVEKIKKLQVELDNSHGDPGEDSYDFWIGFMGGSGTLIGQTCSSISSQSMDSLPAIRKMPNPQDQQSKDNVVLQKLVARQGVFALFAPPRTTPSTGTRFGNVKFLQFLGFVYPYKAVTEQSSAEEVTTFIQKMVATGEKGDVDFASFMLESHTKCYVRRAFRVKEVVHSIGDSEEWKSISVHLLDSKDSLLKLMKKRGYQTT
jgi:hypothetical protein